MQHLNMSFNFGIKIWILIFRLWGYLSAFVDISMNKLWAWWLNDTLEASKDTSSDAFNHLRPTMI